MLSTKCFDHSLDCEVDILQDELRRKEEKPDVSPSKALELAQEHFGLRFPGGTETGSVESIIKELDSYDDKNFRIRAEQGPNGSTATYVLKIHNGVESDRNVHVDAQNAALLHLNSRSISCPVPLPTKVGKSEYVAMVELKIKGSTGSKRFAVRLLTYITGEPLNVIPVTAVNVQNVGRYLGKISQAFEGFTHKGTKRRHQWDLRNTLLTKGYVQYCGENVRGVVEQVLQAFEEKVFPVQDSLRMAVLHGDFNDANILMAQDGIHVAGVLDLGDMVYSSVINDLAIAMA